MELDRRQFLQLGALAAGARAPPGRSTPAVLDVVHICNAQYYLTGAGLRRLPVGEPLELRFDYDPGFCEQASAGFYWRGAKVGDAPRIQREALGRMLLAGRRLDAVLDEVRAPTEHRDWSAQAVVRLHPGVALSPPAMPVSRGFGECEAMSIHAARFVRLVGAAAGREPVFLSGSYVNNASSRDAAPGQPLRLVPHLSNDRDRRVAYQTLCGRRLGTHPLYEGRFFASMVNSGLVLGAVALPPIPHNDTLWTATYLLS